jgi:hypothetical protein
VADDYRTTSSRQPLSEAPLTGAWRDALDGKNTWGFVEIGPAKAGFRWYRLTVLPPGVTDADHARVRTLSVVLVDRHYDPRTADQFARLKSIAGDLRCADLLLEQGELSVVEHEHLWGLAYDRLAPDRSDSTETQDTGS